MRKTSTLLSASPVRKSFTLIELLVVIAIIAILAAMLMPALQQARNTAKKTSCLSNISQLSKATMFYQDASEDFFPWGAYDGSITSFFYYFKSNPNSADRFKAPLRNFFPAEKAYENETSTGASGFALYQTLGSGTAVSKYACPATAETSMKFTSAETVAPNIPPIGGLFKTFGVNSNLVNCYGTKPVRMTIVKRPSRLLTYGDSCGSGYTGYQCRIHPDTASKNSYALSARHNGAANIVYADGHAATVRWDDIPAYKYSSTRFPYEGPDLNPWAK